MSKFDKNINEKTKYGKFIGRIIHDNIWIDYHRTPKGDLIEEIIPLVEYMDRNYNIVKEPDYRSIKTTKFDK